MRSYPVPSNERARLAALRRTDGLGSVPDERLDRITRELAQAFDCPTALVSVVGDTEQVFRARHGFDACETTREGSICAQLIMDRQATVICDTLADPRFSALAAVTEAPHVRFYVGAPIVIDGGFRAGSLCVLDTTPRERPSDAAVALLERRAAEVGRIISSTAPQTAKAPVEAAHVSDAVPKIDRPPISIERTSDDPSAVMIPNQDASPGEGDPDPAEIARREFLNLVGHELRTPLTMLKGYAGLLESRVDLECDKKLVSALRRVTEHLHAVIEGVVNFSDLKSGERMLDEGPTEIADLLESSERMVTPGIDLAGKTFAAHRHGLPPAIHVDRAQVQLVLVSLLENALRYGGQNISMTARLTPDRHMDLIVADDGSEIPEETAETMFRPFALTTDIKNHGAAGLGLKLALSRRIVEMHGGELTFARESSYTTFTVTLPGWRLRASAAPDPGG